MTNKYEYNTLKSANEKIESLQFRYNAALTNHEAYVVAAEKDLAEVHEKFVIAENSNNELRQRIVDYQRGQKIQMDGLTLINANLVSSYAELKNAELAKDKELSKEVIEDSAKNIGKPSNINSLFNKIKFCIGQLLGMSIFGLGCAVFLYLFKSASGFEFYQISYKEFGGWFLGFTIVIFLIVCLVAAVRHAERIEEDQKSEGKSND